MTRKYSLIIEGDDAGYSGYVPELRPIVVTGNSIEDLTARAKEASVSIGRPCTPIGPRPRRFGKSRSNCRSRAIVTVPCRDLHAWAVMRPGGPSGDQRLIR